MNSVDFGVFLSQALIYRHRLSHLVNENHCIIATHTHEWCELLLLESGGVIYTVDGRTYHTEKNALLLTRPGSVHSIEIREQEYQRYDILFDDTKLPCPMGTLLSKDTDLISLNGNRHILQLFQKMDFYCKHLEGEQLERILLHLVEEILCNIAIADKQTHIEDPFMKQVLKYIESHLTEQVDLDAICNAFFISKSHLHKQFVKHMQVSPKKYIITRRLILAQHAIRMGEKPTVACSNCGFADYSSFYREYKKYFGIAPSEEKNRELTDLILS